MTQVEERKKIDSERVFNMSKPVHSDFLIYWTGRDFDEDRYVDLTSSYSSKTSDKITDLYLERFISILKYGLWMCKSKGDEKININKNLNKKPIIKSPVARACFTELRLSEVRKHALNYGRLGIGVKRYFVFDRLGGPMVYVQERTNNLLFPPFSDFLSNKKEMLSFVKHMCPPGRTPKRYDLFDESEWRIIYSESIREKIEKSDVDNSRKQEILNSFIKPSEIKDKTFQDYIKEHDEEKKLEYLIPLDRWFAMIIYPSLAVKLESERCRKIRCLIKKLKPDLPKGEKPYGDARDEIFNKPIELNLDACRNF